MAQRRAPENALANATLRSGACAARQQGRKERRAPRVGSKHSPQARARTRGVTGKHATARSAAQQAARLSAGGAHSAAGATAALIRAAKAELGRCCCGGVRDSGQGEEQGAALCASPGTAQMRILATHPCARHAARVTLLLLLRGLTR